MSHNLQAGGRDHNLQTTETVCKSGPPMNLMDLPYDPVAQIIGKLGFKDQLALRPLCKRARDLTTGAALANRLAHVLFFQRGCGMTGVNMIFFPYAHPRDCFVGLRRCPYLDTKARRFQNASPDWWKNASCPVLVTLTSATIRCSGYEHSSRLDVSVYVHFETYVETANTWETGVGEWEKDKVQLCFEVTAEGGVEGISVVFREGFAERRGAIVGDLLAEVLKNAAAAATAAASLSAASFENCDDTTRADVVTRALAHL